MKNNFLKLSITLFFLINTNLFGEELDIKANQMKLNKETKTILAEGSVQISDPKKNIIFAEKAEYDKLKGIVMKFAVSPVYL